MKATDLVTFWDEAIEEFLAGTDPRSTHPELAVWAEYYSGRGRGRVTPESMPEPYIGSLTGAHADPRVVILGLNPGRQDLEFQGPDGLFADEIRTLGSYSAWASSAPYSRDPWVQRKGRNKYHDLRLEFARRWTRDVNVGAGQLLLLEFYPWHSIGVTATMAPDPGIIREFVWEPVADIAVALVFAFGADWRRTAEALKLPEHPLTVPFTTRSRQVRRYQLPGGQQLIVLWHSGSASPPRATEVALLLDALTAQS